MKKRSEPPKKLLPWLALVPTLLCAAGAWADDPIEEMEDTSRASYYTLDVYTVQKGAEGDFLTKALRAGPYDRISMGFASEKIIEVLPTKRDEDTTYIFIGRYFDGDMGGRVAQQRQPATQRLSRETPVRLQGKVVDVLLSDWTWERNRGTGRMQPASNLVRAMPYQDEARVFEQYNASLNFMKIGYVGQTATVEFFGPETSLDEIRKSITSRPGMSGTTIFALTNGAGHAAYTEYYEMPATLKGLRLERSNSRLKGVAAGVVIENYMAR